MKEYFTYPQSAELVKSFDEIARGLASREQVFDDFLTPAVCSLAGGTMEDEYLRTVKPYTEGNPGKRPIDKIVHVYARLIEVMEETREDILGDVFEGGITRGQNGQYFTPQPICHLMDQLSSGESDGKTVNDPTCGSGRLLLAAAKIDRNRFFVGQDIDHRCVRICALNLALWNLYGQVIWGNSLTLERKLIYETGFDGKSAIRLVKPEPPPPQPPMSARMDDETPEAETPAGGPSMQGSLFDGME